MAVTLHRCPFTFLHTDFDACWKVQKALDEQGIDYEIRKEMGFPRGRRKEIIEKTGQHYLPVIEFEDGSVYRDESDEMAKTIRAGQLFDRAASGAAAQA